MNDTKPFAALLLVLSAIGLIGCRANQPIVLASATDEAASARAVAERPRAAVLALLASLDQGQRAKALRPVDHPLREDWHFVPRDRQGLPLGELDARQKGLVHKLMQTALSDSGYLKATDIIWLETVLAELEQNPAYRDAGKYAVLVFGDPADESAAWGWRFEGHHLSLNLTYTADGIGVTPLFFGTNPAVVSTGPLAGKRVLADAHNLALQLAASMSEEQRKKMMLAETPRDVISAPGREASLEKPIGISGSELDENQRIALLVLAGMYWDTYQYGHRQEWVNHVLTDANYPDLFRFAWAGPIDADGVFYYRISNERFVIEYSCQGANHVHGVMHDLTDPLQEDLLKQHFEQHGHGE